MLEHVYRVNVLAPLALVQLVLPSMPGGGRIVSVTSDVPFVHAWNQARSDGSSYEVFVEIRPNDVLRPGRTITNLHVKTSLPDAQDVKVPVWVEVR